MRLRNVKNAKEKLMASSYCLFYEGKKLDASIFSNKNPIHLEIGCGKGQFLINMAKEYPNINFIGVEKYESVLVRAIEKVEKEKLDNLKFICVDAKEIDDVFSSFVDVIYLNFSDPWPKTRHEKRRLTSKVFLEKYDVIFKGEKHIYLKTDNISFFAYSLESLSQYGYTFLKVSLDLHNEPIFNIKTEYEEKFSKMGININCYNLQPWQRISDFSLIFLIHIIQQKYTDYLQLIYLSCRIHSCHIIYKFQYNFLY